ncbi:MAG: Panacea domain-containing protein [Methanobacteriaceae archaeon]|nr:Panacea domain-containing protein [Methanobacteriaceae archaeon]
MIHYIISNYGLNHNVDRSLIYKLLYFSDFDFYELYEKSISGEKYIRKPQEPIPNHFIEIKNELIDECKIKETQIPIITYSKYNYSSLKSPDISSLNKIEITVINDTLNKLSSMLSRQISDYSHGDLPWRIAEDNEELNYEYVFYRDPEYSVRNYNK